MHCIGEIEIYFSISISESKVTRQLGWINSETPDKPWRSSWVARGELLFIVCNTDLAENLNHLIYNTI